MRNSLSIPSALFVSTSDATGCPSDAGRGAAGLAVVLALLVGTAGVAVGQQKAESSKDASNQAERELSEAAKLLKGAQRSYHEGRWYRSRELYQKSYEQADKDSPVRVQAALGISTLLWEQGHYAGARKRIDEAMDLAEELELDTAIGRLLLTLGHIEASQGQLASAEGTLRHCVKLAAEQNDPVFGPLCKLNHRLVRKLQGKSVGSKAAYRKALKRLESVDSPLTAGLSLAKTAELYAEGGQRGQAFQLLNRAGKQYEKAGSVPAQARNRMLKARILQETGRWGKARKYLKGLVDTFDEMGSKPALVEALGLLGNDAQHRRDWKAARDYYDRALKTARLTGSPQLVAKVRVALCELGARTGSYADSVSHCEEAIGALEDLGMWKVVAKAQSSMGRAAQAAGELEQARSALLSATQTREERVHAQLRSATGHAHDLANLCQIEMRMQIEGALYRCRKALKHLDEKRDSRAMIAATHYALGNAAASEGHPKEATEHLEKAAAMYRKTEQINVKRYADTRLRLGAIYKRRDEPKKALGAFRDGVKTLDKNSSNRARSYRIQLRTQYAQLLLQREKWKRASSQLETLAEEARQSGDTGTRAWALSALARAHNGMGEHEAAERSLREALPLAEKAGDEALVETVRGNLEQYAD